MSSISEEIEGLKKGVASLRSTVERFEKQKNSESDQFVPIMKVTSVNISLSSW